MVASFGGLLKRLMVLLCTPLAGAASLQWGIVIAKCPLEGLGLGFKHSARPQSPSHAWQGLGLGSWSWQGPREKVIKRGMLQW
jgi:hypothetical protein